MCNNYTFKAALLMVIAVPYLPLKGSLLCSEDTYYYSNLLFLQLFGEGIVGNVGFSSVRPFLSMPTKTACVAKICEVLG